MGIDDSIDVPTKITLKRWRLGSKLNTGAHVPCVVALYPDLIINRTFNTACLKILFRVRHYTWRNGITRDVNLPRKAVGKVTVIRGAPREYLERSVISAA